MRTNKEDKERNISFSKILASGWAKGNCAPTRQKSRMIRGKCDNLLRGFLCLITALLVVFTSDKQLNQFKIEKVINLINRFIPSVRAQVTPPTCPNPGLWHLGASTEELRFGDHSYGTNVNCSTKVHSISNDLCNNIYLGGITQSKELSYDDSTMDSCFTDPTWAGYVTRIENGVHQWTKTFLGFDNDKIEVPYIAVPIWSWFSSDQGLNQKTSGYVLALVRASSDDNLTQHSHLVNFDSSGQIVLVWDFPFDFKGDDNNYAGLYFTQVNYATYNEFRVWAAYRDDQQAANPTPKLWTLRTDVDFTTQAKTNKVHNKFEEVSNTKVPFGMMSVTKIKSYVYVGGSQFDSGSGQYKPYLAVFLEDQRSDKSFVLDVGSANVLSFEHITGNQMSPTGNSFFKAQESVVGLIVERDPVTFVPISTDKIRIATWKEFGFTGGFSCPSDIFSYTERQIHQAGYLRIKKIVVENTITIFANFHNSAAQWQNQEYVDLNQIHLRIEIKTLNLNCDPNASPKYSSNEPTVIINHYLSPFCQMNDNCIMGPMDWTTRGDYPDGILVVSTPRDQNSLTLNGGTLSAVNIRYLKQYCQYQTTPCNVINTSATGFQEIAYTETDMGTIPCLNASCYFRDSQTPVVADDLPVYHQICGETSQYVAPSPLTTAQKTFDYGLYESTGTTIYYAETSFQDIVDAYSAVKCRLCLITFQIFEDLSESIPHGGSKLTYDSVSKKLSVKTTLPFQQIFYLKNSFNDSHCSYLPTYQTPIDIQVCGNENVDSNYPLSYLIEQRIFVAENTTAHVIAPSELTSWFASDNTGRCPLTYTIWSENFVDPSFSWVTYDVIGGIKIDFLNESYKEVGQSMSFVMGVQATSKGLQNAYQKVNVTFINNAAPEFQEPLSNLSLDIDQNEVDSGFNGEPIFQYRTSVPVDSQSNEIKLLTSISPLPNPKVLYQFIHPDNSVSIFVNKERASRKDAIKYTIIFNLTDQLYPSSKQQSQYNMTLTIYWISQVYDPSAQHNSSSFVPSYQITEKPLEPPTEPQEQIAKLVELQNTVKQPIAQGKSLETLQTNKTDEEGVQGFGEVQDESKKTQPTDPEITGEVIKPSFNPWATKVSEEKMDELFGSMAQKEYEVKAAQSKKHLPVILKIIKFSRDGLITIKFNQKLYVPPFINREIPELYSDSVASNDTQRRELIPLKDIEIQKYLFDFKYVSNNEEVSFKELSFYLELREWQETHMTVFCNFSVPLQISRGIRRDSVILEVRNTDLFVSKDTHMKLKLERRYIQKPIPRQLPVGVSENEIIKNAQSSSEGARYMIIGQILLQLCLEGSMTYIWNLYFTMQIICYLYIYDVNFPANTEIYLEEFIKLLEFQFLKPDKFIREFIDEDFSYSKLTTGFTESSIELDSDQGENMYDNMMIFAILIGLFVLLVCCLCLCLIIKRCRSKVSKLLTSLFNMMVFNGIIEAILISYVYSMVQCCIQLEKWGRGDKFQAQSEKAVGLAIYIMLILFPLFLIFILHSSQADIKNRGHFFNQRLSILLQDVYYKKGYWASMYIPIFLLRRVLFVSFPTFLFFWPFSQIQLVLFFSSLYIIFYGQVLPHNRLRTGIELFNECMIIICAYHLICFSNMNLNIQSGYIMGYSFVGCIAFVVFVNAIVISRAILKQLMFKRFLRKKKTTVYLVHKRLSLNMMLGQQEKFTYPQEKIQRMSLKILDNVIAEVDQAVQEKHKFLQQQFMANVQEVNVYIGEEESRVVIRRKKKGKKKKKSKKKHVYIPQQKSSKPLALFNMTTIQEQTVEDDQFPSLPLGREFNPQQIFETPMKPNRRLEGMVDNTNPGDSIGNWNFESFEDSGSDSRRNQHTSGRLIKSLSKRQSDNSGFTTTPDTKNSTKSSHDLQSAVRVRFMSSDDQLNDYNSSPSIQRRVLRHRSDY